MGKRGIPPRKLEKTIKAMPRRFPGSKWPLRASCRRCMVQDTKPLEHGKTQTALMQSAFFGPSGATRTPGLLNPNQARYQLRYTRIFNFCHYTTVGVKIKDFLSVVIPVVKTAFVPFSATGGNPANAGVARLCDVSPHPIPDTTTALPKQARYRLRYTWILCVRKARTVPLLYMIPPEKATVILPARRGCHSRRILLQ